MPRDHRKSTRRVLQHGARITLADGSDFGPCQICDISGSGARLEVDRVGTLPDNFILLLSYDGRLRRQCSVVWRARKVVGVEFIPDCPFKASPETRQVSEPA